MSVNPFAAMAARAAESGYLDSPEEPEGVAYAGAAESEAAGNNIVAAGYGTELPRWAGMSRKDEDAARAFFGVSPSPVRVRMSPSPRPREMGGVRRRRSTRTATSRGDPDDGGGEPPPPARSGARRRGWVALDLLRLDPDPWAVHELPCGLWRLNVLRGHWLSWRRGFTWREGGRWVTDDARFDRADTALEVGPFTTNIGERPTVGLVLPVEHRGRLQ